MPLRSKILVSHPTGNANVRAALNGFLEGEMLLAFVTSIASFDGDWLDKLSSLPFFKEISRRKFNPLLKEVTRTYPFKEIGRLVAAKAGLTKLVRHERGVFSIDEVYHTIDRKTAGSLINLKKKDITGVYAYEDGAEETFNAAKKLNLQCFYDLPIGYWKTARQLLESEKEKWPDWASTLTGFKDSQEKLNRKDRELRLADRIFVASHFTAKTLQQFPGTLSPIEIIPYGFPAVYENRSYENIQHRPLKLLFVGGLSQRKGIANLFAAVEKFKNRVTLTVVGRGLISECSALASALNKHTWIPALPHDDILKLMRQHDVFVFPSLFEGFGLVITEAMSQGTPVITTDRTAGPDIIHDGHNGWLISAGSTEALEQSIENILYNPSVIKKTGIAAMETAQKRPWAVYGKELAAAVLRNSR